MTNSLQRGDGVGKISARRLQRAIRQAELDLRNGGPGFGRNLPYLKAVGRNETSDTLVPGNPVYLGEYHYADGTNYASYQDGWYSLYHARLPLTPSEVAALDSAQCDMGRVGVTLDYCAPGACTWFALDGIVEVNCPTGIIGYGLPGASNDVGYKTALKVNAWCGMRLVGRADPANLRSHIRLGDRSLDIPYTLLQNWQGTSPKYAQARMGIGASITGSPPAELLVHDINSVATWQGAGDGGWARQIGNMFVAVIPYCIDESSGPGPGTGGGEV